MSRRRSFVAFLAIFGATALAAVPGRALEAPRLLADIVPGDAADARPSAGGFIRLGDRLIFSTLGATADDEAILWATDGTAEGTLELTSRLCPIGCEEIRPLGSVGGVALLAPRPGRLWRTDGTPAGTFPVTGRFDSTGETARVAPDSPFLFFTACGPILGCELWRSDGTKAGTRMVRDIAPGPGGSNPHSLTPFHGKLYFLAGGATLADTGLWSTDGTPEGTRFVAPSVNNSVNGDTVLGATPSRLFFTSLNTTEQLFASDGTPRGTRLVHRFQPPPCTEHDLCQGPILRYLLPVGDEMIFTASDGVHGPQFWSSDGTRAGTRQRSDLRASPLDIASIPQPLKGRWIFSAPQRPAGTTALWTVDGSFAHPAPVTGCQGGCPEVQFLFPPPAPIPAPSHLLFAGTDPAHGAELWATDGTGPGTRRLADICPGPCSAFFDQGPDVALGEAAGRTYFWRNRDRPTPRRSSG